MLYASQFTVWFTCVLCLHSISLTKQVSVDTYSIFVTRQLCFVTTVRFPDFPTILFITIQHPCSKVLHCSSTFCAPLRSLRSALVAAVFPIPSCLQSRYWFVNNALCYDTRVKIHTLLPVTVDREKCMQMFKQQLHVSDSQQTAHPPWPAAWSHRGRAAPLQKASLFVGKRLRSGQRTRQ